MSKPKPQNERLPYMSFISTFKWEELTPGEIELIVYLLLEETAPADFILKKITQEKLDQWTWEYFLLDHDHTDYYFKLSEEAKTIIKFQLGGYSAAKPSI